MLGYLPAAAAASPYAMYYSGGAGAGGLDPLTAAMLAAARGGGAVPGYDPARALGAVQQSLVTFQNGGRVPACL